MYNNDVILIVLCESDVTLIKIFRLKCYENFCKIYYVSSNDFLITAHDLKFDAFVTCYSLDCQPEEFWQMKEALPASYKRNC